MKSLQFILVHTSSGSNPETNGVISPSDIATKDIDMKGLLQQNTNLKPGRAAPAGRTPGAPAVVDSGSQLFYRSREAGQFYIALFPPIEPGEDHRVRPLSLRRDRGTCFSRVHVNQLLGSAVLSKWQYC